MAEGDMEQEFIDTFRAYGDAIFRFCMVKVSNRELAEDMTQEVFTRYWQSLRSGKEMTHVRSLLYTIAHNLAKDWYKRKKAVSLDDRLEAGFEPEDTTATPLEQAEYEEVLRTLRDMDEGDRTVLYLRYVEGLGPAHISEILGERPNVISVRINRALARLKERMHT